MIKLIYVSGPYSGKNKSKNILKVAKEATRIWKLGAAALCPHLNSMNFDGFASYESFLAGDLRMLNGCDAIYLIRGWRESPGACTEKEYAENHNIPILYSIGEVKEFIDKATPRCSITNRCISNVEQMYGFFMEPSVASKVDLVMKAKDREFSKKFIPLPKL